MEIADRVLTLGDDDAPLQAGLEAAERRIRESLARIDRATAAGPGAGATPVAAAARRIEEALAAPGRPGMVTAGRLGGGPVAGLAAGATQPLIGTLHVTVEREHPRAVQAGIEMALAELGQRAELAGALD